MCKSLIMDELLEEVAFANVHGFITDNHFSPEIQQIFEDNAVEMECLITMTEGDLKEIGVNEFGDRRRISKAIDALREDKGTGENTQELAQQSDQSDFTDRQIGTPALRKATSMCTSSSGSYPKWTRPSVCIKQNQNKFQFCYRPWCSAYEFNCYLETYHQF
ncbi:uncharacterized protein LOC117108797 [Anneissia japonica]|uniref:uncharacterized protein LOC117108797 n=1 Tax=Anneissia japonica TaxID=1529436 RepID=UPI0014256100|nr:uncharacterized protein LOC117108797 [Anneissia japonica]